MNPDTRPLPYGFVQRFDSNYQTWYYVNALATPPVPSWRHPADEFPSGPPHGWHAPSYHGDSSYGHHNGSGHYGGHDDHHKKKSGGGMGTAAAVGVGAAAGIVGGVLIADAINDAQEEAYQEGFEAGAGGGDESD